MSNSCFDARVSQIANPLLDLDFLDREALGGLAAAIRDWNGAVLMISHSEEFVGALCPETWMVENGRLTQKGKRAVQDDAFDDSASTGTGAFDSDASGSAMGENGSGSVVDDKLQKHVDRMKAKRKKLTNAQRKEREVRRRMRHLEWLSSGKGLEDKPEDTDSD